MNSGQFYFERGTGKSYDRAMAARTDEKESFRMKTISFLITWLLVVTQPLGAGQRGGGVGFALPNHSSIPPHPTAPAPTAQTSQPRLAPQTRIHVQPTSSQQGAAQPVATPRRAQNQNQNQSAINPRDSAAVGTRPDRHERHDREWWRRHFRTIVFVLGGYYYWDDGYWYPALGYDPNYSYDYDGPIYAYGNLLPDQVIANVQTQLQQDGYYFGPVNGSIDSVTRAAIANYQRDYGLLVTATVDQPTVESLGLA
jgi:hypothetical protein